MIIDIVYVKQNLIPIRHHALIQYTRYADNLLHQPQELARY